MVVRSWGAGQGIEGTGGRGEGKGGVKGVPTLVCVQRHVRCELISSDHVSYITGYHPPLLGHGRRHRERRARPVETLSVFDRDGEGVSS